MYRKYQGINGEATCLYPGAICKLYTCYQEFMNSWCYRMQFWLKTKLEDIILLSLNGATAHKTTIVILAYNDYEWMVQCPTKPQISFPTQWYGAIPFPWPWGVFHQTCGTVVRRVDGWRWWQSCCPPLPHSLGSPTDSEHCCCLDLMWAPAWGNKDVYTIHEILHNILQYTIF